MPTAEIYVILYKSNLFQNNIISYQVITMSYYSIKYFKAWSQLGE